MKLYAVYGASGCGREVMPLLRQQMTDSGPSEYELVFIDDYQPSDEINGHRVLNYQQFLREDADGKYVSIAISDTGVREKLAKKCHSDNLSFIENISSSHVVIMDRCEIGEGSILCPFVTLTSNVKIGRHFHANLYSSVAHDCVIGDYVTLAPGVKCNGNVVIEDYAYVGTGAVIRQGGVGAPLVIGRGATVGMGAVVTKSVAPGTTVVGNPARPIVQ